MQLYKRSDDLFVLRFGIKACAIEEKLKHIGEF